MRRFAKWLVIIFVSLWAIKSASHISATSAPDFSVFYDSAINLLSGKNIYADLALFTGFNYPPTTLILFLPFTILPYQLAQGLWVLAGLAALVLSVRLLHNIFQKKADWKSVAYVSSIFFLLFPVRFTLGMGQVNLVALLFLLLFLRGLQKNRLFPGMISLVVAWLLKPQLIFLLPALLFFREARRIAIWSVVGLTALTWVTGLLFGWQNFLVYLAQVLSQFSVYSGREIYFNQSLGGLWSRLFFVGIADTITKLTSIILIVVVGLRLFRLRMPLVRVTSIWLGVMLLVEPIAWQHHLVFLLPLVYYLWQVKKFVSIEKIPFWIGVILIGVNIKDPSWWQVLPLGNLILSHGALGVILILLSGVTR